ncbi:MAG: LysR family transcriptional regulator [Oscillospiraceae bacterium]
MTLLQIKYALAIADTSSMNKAAERLYISQPNLTGAVRELEKELGIQIFIRTNRGVIPTAEGADFLASARQVFQQYELLEEKYSGGAQRRRFAVSTQHYSFAIKAFSETVKKYDTLNFDFAIRETKTMEVIDDVGALRSEIGILFLSSFNRRLLMKLFAERSLEFTPIIECRAFAYLWGKHPLANEKSVSMEQLREYPCLSFEQGSGSSLFLAEEILADYDYPRTIKVNDRATMLNLMVGLNGYTLCSGIICEELNGSGYNVVPLEGCGDAEAVMEVGYIIKKHSVLSDIGQTYLAEVKRYLGLN